MSRFENILYICSHVPSLNAHEAGQKTAWRNLLELAETAKVDVLLLVNSWEVAEVPECWPDNIRLVGVQSVTKSEKLLAVVRNFRKCSPKFAVRRSRKSIALVGKVLQQTLYTKVWFEFTESAGVLSEIPTGIPFVISAHDVLVQWALRKPGVWRYLSPRIYDDELKVFSTAEQIVTYSSKDAGLLRGLYGVANVEIKELALSSFVTTIRRGSLTVRNNTVLFWGAMSRPENFRAISKFLDSCWPKILEKFPDAIIYVVGSNPPDLLKRRMCHNVIVTGYVDDPSPYFQMAAVGIAPLEEGAGVKVKVLEMLKVGIPVVSTPVGAEGIDKSDKLLVTGLEKFPDVIALMLGEQMEINKAIL